MDWARKSSEGCTLDTALEGVAGEFSWGDLSPAEGLAEPVGIFLGTHGVAEDDDIIHGEGVDFVLDLFVAEGPALLTAAVVPSSEQFLTDQFLVRGRVDALVSIEVRLDGSRLEGVLLNLVVDRGHVFDYMGLLGKSSDESSGPSL